MGSLDRVAREKTILFVSPLLIIAPGDGDVQIADLRAQGVAVQAQDVGGLELVAAGGRQRPRDQRPLDLADQPAHRRRPAEHGRTKNRAAPRIAPPAGVYDRLIREVERPLIARALAATRGNQLKAADVLGLNRNTLRKKIRDLDIHVSRAP